MKMIISCVIFEQPLVVSCLIFALMVVILACLVYRYKIKKAQMLKVMADAERKHELDMKEKSFEKELFWHFLNETGSDFKKEMDGKISKLSEEIEMIKELLDKDETDS